MWMSWVLPPSHPKPEPQRQPVDEFAAVERRALDSLKRRGINAKRVIRVDTRSILYITDRDVPMTAWKFQVGARTELRYEAGFPTEPAEDLIPVPAVVADGKGAE